MDKDILKEVGLTTNETDVYLTLLKEGSISVNNIAEKAGLHRQAVYDALDRLLEKGFVSFVTRNNKKHFQGIHPQKILEYLQEKRGENSEYPARTHQPHTTPPRRHICGGVQGKRYHQDRLQGYH